MPLIFCVNHRKFLQKTASNLLNSAYAAYARVIRPTPVHSGFSRTSTSLSRLALLTCANSVRILGEMLLFDALI